MAKSTRRPPRKPTPINSNVAVEEPPPDFQADIPPAFQSPAAEAAPPVHEDVQMDAARHSVKTPTFYQTINKIAKADWGPRANLYLYRVEPVIDRTRSGDSKFIQVYAEPVNEDRIMADCGSGRYKLMLNFRKAGADTGDLLDSIYIDILNMKYPPKIPIGEWTDDPRNKKWAWAKEALAPQPAQPAAPLDPLAHLNTFMDIQDRIEDRLKPATPATGTAAPVDPWTAAEKILNMRSDNPMVEILKQQMADNAKSAEAERERAFRAAESAREREFKLQEKLLEARTAAPSTPPEKPKTLMEQLTDFKALKDVFTNGNGAGEARAARTTGLDLARELGGKLFEGPIAEGLGQWIGSLATRHQNGNGAPIMNNPAPTNGVQQTAPDSMQKFINDVVNPALLSHYIRGLSGSDFAAWLADGYPARVAELQNFTHPMIPGKRGAAAIITAYQHTPQMWPALSSQGEERFTQFVQEFCAWRPEPEDDAIEVEGHTIDHEEGEEGPERI